MKLKLVMLITFLLATHPALACKGGCGGGCGCGGGSCGGSCGDSCSDSAAVKKVRYAVDNQTLAAAKSVENTVCPTCDDAIDDKSKVQAYHKGKLVNLCCESCMEEFEKDPVKYLKKAELKK